MTRLEIEEKIKWLNERYEEKFVEAIKQLNVAFRLLLAYDREINDAFCYESSLANSYYQTGNLVTPENDSFDKFITITYLKKLKPILDLLENTFEYRLENSLRQATPALFHPSQFGQGMENLIKQSTKIKNKLPYLCFKNIEKKKDDFIFTTKNNEKICCKSAFDTFLKHNPKMDEIFSDISLDADNLPCLAAEKMGSVFEMDCVTAFVKGPFASTGYIYSWNEFTDPKTNECYCVDWLSNFIMKKEAYNKLIVLLMPKMVITPDELALLQTARTEEMKKSEHTETEFESPLLAQEYVKRHVRNLTPFELCRQIKPEISIELK